MLLFAPVFLALLAATLRGGSVRHLADLPLRGVPAMLLALALQVALYLPGVRASPVVAAHGAALYVATLALAIAAALANWRLGVAVRLATVGLTLNTLAIIANGGYMPTNKAAMRAVRGAATVRDIADHNRYGNTRLATPATRLVLLSDVIPIPFPPGGGNVYSIGDVLLAVGVAGLTYKACVDRWPIRAGRGAPSCVPRWPE